MWCVWGTGGIKLGYNIILWWGRGVYATELDNDQIEQDLSCSVEECRLDSLSEGSRREDTWLDLSLGIFPPTTLKGLWPYVPLSLIHPTLSWISSFFLYFLCPQMFIFLSNTMAKFWYLWSFLCTLLLNHSFIYSQPWAFLRGWALTPASRHSPVTGRTGRGPTWNSVLTCEHQQINSSHSQAKTDAGCLSPHPHSLFLRGNKASSLVCDKRGYVNKWTVG